MLERILLCHSSERRKHFLEEKQTNIQLFRGTHFFDNFMTIDLYVAFYLK